MNDGWQDTRTRSYLPQIVVPGLFSSDECARIIQLFAERPLEPGRMWDGVGFVVNTTKRGVDTAYVPRSEDTAWIYDRMDSAFFRLAKVWGIEVRTTLEDLKYVVYRPGSHFAQWHMDSGPDYSNLRKLSMSVELNGSADYEGGELPDLPRGQRTCRGSDPDAGDCRAVPVAPLSQSDASGPRRAPRACELDQRTTVPLIDETDRTARYIAAEARAGRAMRVRVVEQAAARHGQAWRLRMSLACHEPG